MCLGVPGRVVTCWQQEGTTMASVDYGGTTQQVCLVYAPEAGVGDHVIVHAGFAIAVLDEQAAAETLALLATLDTEAVDR
jgi:hydrogenase expression/formation protein HypC